MTLNIAPVNLAATINAALETVHLAAEAKHIQIQTVVTPISGNILGDANRLQQVIWNLLSNTVKFTSEGGQVVVRLEQVEIENIEETCRPEESIEPREQSIELSSKLKALGADLIDCSSVEQYLESRFQWVQATRQNLLNEFVAKLKSQQEQ